MTDIIYNSETLFIISESLLRWFEEKYYFLSFTEIVGRKLSRGKIKLTTVLYVYFRKNAYSL